MVVFVLGVIVTVLVVVLLMVELELVGAVDNKAGHYSVSPGRQQAAGRVGQMGRERERERERGYTCSGAGGRRPHERHQLRPTRANKRRNECGSSLCAGAGAKHSGRSGLGMGRRPLSGIHFLLFFLGKATSALDRANGFSSHIFSCPKTSRGRLGREDKHLGREVMVTRETTCNLLAGENS